jgi:hypothetical protein
MMFRNESIEFQRFSNPIVLDRAAFVAKLSDVPPKPVEMDRVLGFNRGLREVETRV